MARPLRFDEVSLDVLDENEQDEYNRLLEAKERVEAGPSQWRYSPIAWVSLVWVPAAAIVFVPTLMMNTPGSPFAAIGATMAGRVLMVIALMSVLLGGPVLIVVLVNRARRTWLQEHRLATDRAGDDFLNRIGYEARARAAAQQSSYDDRPYDGLSTKQRQHAWYGDHSELNWRDREFGERWGLSADEVSQWNNSNDPD